MPFDLLNKLNVTIRRRGDLHVKRGLGVTSQLTLNAGVSRRALTSANQFHFEAAATWIPVNVFVSCYLIKATAAPCDTVFPLLQ